MLAAGIVEHTLTRADRIERRTPSATCLGDAGADDEALPALGVAIDEAGFDSTAFFRQSRPLGGVAVGTLCRNRQHLHRRSEQHCGDAARDANSATHVNDVSTVRRASAKNSAEPISRSRDAVRGNSCASGPSV